ncbi:MAG TPA: C45 family peptidase [Bryobacteraceae bacterium]|nr:C45 family peptidase [Bryobacteraceae bacterium]
MGVALTAAEAPSAPDHTLTVISGRPRERGIQYGRKFREPIRSFLEKEIYETFTKTPPKSSTQAPNKEEMLRYAALCGKEIRGYSPVIMQELEGMAEGAGLELEEAVLLSLHEELWHRGNLPAPEHCTALAAGPPDTSDGSTYVAQSWDWMQRVYGMSSLLLWKRPEGPSLLSYSYPGLWAGAGMNSSGIALVWTSAENTMKLAGPRVGIPSYVLIAQILYQETLQAAVAEARRAKQAGWFTFVLADGSGQLANIEGSPGELAVEFTRGSFARTYYGSRQMTRTPPGEPVRVHPQCQRMFDLLRSRKGHLNRTTLQGFYGDHESTICKHFGTLDVMLFNTTRREAWVERGPGCSGKWKRFTFEDA